MSGLLSDYPDDLAGYEAGINSFLEAKSRWCIPPPAPFLRRPREQGVISGSRWAETCPFQIIAARPAMVKSGPVPRMTLGHRIENVGEILDEGEDHDVVSSSPSRVNRDK